jgi:hypothetical protein
VKTNPFPWFPWWPKVEESHYVPIIIIALVLAVVLIYFLGCSLEPGNLTPNPFPSGKGNRRFGRSAFLNTRIGSGEELLRT